MPVFCLHARCTACVFGLFLTIAAIGCGKQDAATESDSASNAATASVPNSSASLLAGVDIPEGSPDELFAFIASLDSEELPSDVSERSDALRQRMAKRVKACDAILSQNVAPDAETSAVQMKLDALRTLSIVDPEGIGADFQTYATSLIDGSDPYLARLAKAKQFQNVVNNFVSNPNGDTQPILDELDNLLASKDAGPRVFMEARDAIGWLVPQTQDQLDNERLTSRMAVVAKCYRAIGSRFVNYDDAQVVGEAKGLLALSDQFELELLRAEARSGDSEPVEKLVKKLEQMFADSTKHGNELGFTIQTAQGLEFDGILQPALSLYELAWKNNKASEDEGLRAHVRRTYDKASTRLSLVGKPLQIKGKLANGDPFDLKEYDGKHVIVCFWESWVDGWQDEIKNMQDIVSKHGKSVEIVTVNLDAPEKLKEYLSNHVLDVTVVSVADKNRSGTECPVAIRHGVDMLPFTVLVGPNGNVDRIHVFGARLSEALGELSK